MRLIVLALLLLNTAHCSFALHTQESRSHELGETLFEDVGRLDGHTRVVLFQRGIEQVYLGPLEL